jgi:hypothetical protein
MSSKAVALVETWCIIIPTPQDAAEMETAMTTETTSRQIEWKREGFRGSQCRDAETTYDLRVDGKLVGYITAQFDYKASGLMQQTGTSTVRAYEMSLMGDRAMEVDPVIQVANYKSRAACLAAAKAWLLARV